VYAGLDENDLAFEWLEKAYQERDWLLVWILPFPQWDSLRPDSRFRALEQRIGLSDYIAARHAGAHQAGGAPDGAGAGGSAGGDATALVRHLVRRLPHEIDRSDRVQPLQAGAEPAPATVGTFGPTPPCTASRRHTRR